MKTTIANSLPSTLTQVSLLALFGHLTPDVFAAAAFPDVAPASRKTTVARAFRRLHDGGLVRGTVNAVGGTSLILTEKGAAFWNGQRDEDVIAGSGEKASIKGPTFAHRQTVSAYLASRIAQPDVTAVIGEFAMNAGSTPLDVARLKKQAGKLPDGLIFRTTTDAETGEESQVIEWVEGESAYKKPIELVKMLEAITKLQGAACVAHFTDNFKGLWGDEAGLIQLTVVMAEADVGHADRLLQAMARMDRAMGSDPGWQLTREHIKVAAVPLRRYSLTLNGDVGTWTPEAAPAAIRERLVERARAEMTAKEKAKEKEQLQAWIAAYDAENARRAAAGEAPQPRVPVPDFGYAIRQDRAPSRRPVHDQEWSVMYPKKKRFDMTKLAQPVAE